MPLSAIDPPRYHALLDEKVATVTALLSPFSPPQPVVYPSPPTGFRLRAEFRVWHEGDDLNYVMFRRGEPKKPIAITELPIAAPSIQTLMPLLLARLKSAAALRRKLFQVEFLSTLDGDMLITLAYHRRLDSSWESSAQDLIDALHQQVPRLSIVGRSRKQKVVLGVDYVKEVLPVNGYRYRYQQVEQSFTQPNGAMNTKMLEWACERATVCRGDLLELYCGNGNFTLPLSRHFDHIIATELSKTAVRSARHNLLENSIENVAIVRLSAEEAAQAMNAERVFRRLSELPQSLDQYDLQTLLIDPPRAGLDEQTVCMASGFANILYISCNPQSLAENLTHLSRTHRIEHFAVFDQFPYTEHLECGVFLQRRL